MYFTGLTTVKSVKDRFMRIAETMHPERGGNREVFAAVYGEYLAMLKALSGEVTVADNNQPITYRFDGDIEQGVVAKLGELFALGNLETKIGLCGTWLWISGNTRPFSAKYKLLGCGWSGDKQMWYWHGGTFRKRGKKPVSFDAIKAKYGYREFSQST